jgi:hypothetical protein
MFEFCEAFQGSVPREVIMSIPFLAFHFQPSSTYVIITFLFMMFVLQFP